jgi:hypothetical protein
MSTSRALVSLITGLDTTFRTDHLKLCCLWYDEVLLETLREGDEKDLIQQLVENEENASRTAKQLSDAIVPLHARVRHDPLGDFIKEGPRGYPRWGKEQEHYDYPEPEDAEQYAHNQLLRFIEAERGVPDLGWDIESAEGRARVAVDAVLLWQRVNGELPCMLQAREDEKVAMAAVQEFQSKGSEPVSPVRLLELAIPSLTEVSWDEVLKLRDSRNVSLLRDKIKEAIDQAGTDLDRAKKILDDFERDAVESIVELGRPNVKKVAIESVLSNIPGALVNPYSVFAGARDARCGQEAGRIWMVVPVAGHQERHPA